jgi:hypothetical protein
MDLNKVASHDCHPEVLRRISGEVWDFATLSWLLQQSLVENQDRAFKS